MTRVESKFEYVEKMSKPIKVTMPGAPTKNIHFLGDLLKKDKEESDEEDPPKPR
jgi:hypothetical protein